jgi:hypothetical protein
MKRFYLTTACFLFLHGATQAAALPADDFQLEDGVLRQFNGINALSLCGTHQEMGLKYGKAMQSKLENALDIILDYYQTQNKIPYADILATAEKFTQRYSYGYALFLEGISEGSGLSIGNCQILNAMETLGSLLSGTKSLGQCAFMALPPEKSYANKTMVGRNYDFPTPYNLTAQDLTVTILKQENAIPTAIISMPGQIYCPSCINQQGIFLELNNGEPSGSFTVATQRESLLINLLDELQDSPTLDDLTSQLLATQSDYSLIINSANATMARSFEFSSILGMKPYFPEAGETFVSTNFYLNTTWTGIPAPTDNTTWMGVTRRDNLLNLAAQQDVFDIADFQKLMDTNITNGGAVWPLTIYQIIYDTGKDLYLKITQTQDEWTQLPLAAWLKN